MHVDRDRFVGVCDGGDLVCDAAGVVGVAGAYAVAFGAGDVAGSGADHDGDAGAFNNPGVDSGYVGGGAASDDLPGSPCGAKPHPTASTTPGNPNDHTSNHVIIESPAGAATSHKSNDSGTHAPNHVIIESQADAAPNHKSNDSGTHTGRTRAGHIFTSQTEGGRVLRPD